MTSEYIFLLLPFPVMPSKLTMDGIQNGSCLIDSTDLNAVSALKRAIFGIKGLHTIPSVLHARYTDSCLQAFIPTHHMVLQEVLQSVDGTDSSCACTQIALGERDRRDHANSNMFSKCTEEADGHLPLHKVLWCTGAQDCLGVDDDTVLHGFATDT